MAELDYACLKDNVVVNIIVFDNPTEELLLHFKNFYSLDDIILANNNARPGGTYDGTKFWLPQPYPSWIKNEEINQWEAPVPYPIVQPYSDEIYTWDENTTSWLLLPPSN